LKNLFITQSRECRFDLFEGHSSKPYKEDCDTFTFN